MAKIKNDTIPIPSVDESIEQLDLSFTAGGGVSWYNRSGQWFGMI